MELGCELGGPGCGDGCGGGGIDCGVCTCWPGDGEDSTGRPLWLTCREGAPAEPPRTPPRPLCHRLSNTHTVRAAPSAGGRAGLLALG